MPFELVYNGLYKVHRFLSYPIALVLFILIILIAISMVICVSLADAILPQDIIDSLRKQLDRMLCKFQ